MILTVAQLAAMIDHSLLHPVMTDEDLQKGCEVALKHSVASVCIKPYAVPEASDWLKNSPVLVCTVVGFPHGSNLTSIKADEAAVACKQGAREIDMVVNIGKVLGQDWNYVSQDIKAVQDVAASNNAILKVIFENDFLQDKHKIKLCEICSVIGVAFVKTSTGYGYVKNESGYFSTRGATLEDIKLMRKHTSPEVAIKAAGGVRTLRDMLAVIDAGASRIGATATEAILGEAARVINGEITVTELSGGTGGY